MHVFGHRLIVVVEGNDNEDAVQSVFNVSLVLT